MRMAQEDDNGKNKRSSHGYRHEYDHGYGYSYSYGHGYADQYSIGKENGNSFKNYEQTHMKWPEAMPCGPRG